MMGFFEMRGDDYTKGLISLIEYVNEITPTKEMRMIEIGSYIGESTSIFCENFKEVLAIDPFYKHNSELDNVYLEFISKTSKYENLNYIRKKSDDAILDLLNEKFDFIYIDGLHTYEQVKRDILNYKSLVTSNGFISGHDYHPNWNEVVNAVDETIGEPDKLFIDTSWIKNIKSNE
jgi:predicted O-methyltransferase YrrM